MKVVRKQAKNNGWRLQMQPEFSICTLISIVTTSVSAKVKEQGVQTWDSEIEIWIRWMCNQGEEACLPLGENGRKSICLEKLCTGKAAVSILENADCHSSKYIPWWVFLVYQHFLQNSLGVDLNQEFHIPNEASKAVINLSTLQALERWAQSWQQRKPRLAPRLYELSVGLQDLKNKQTTPANNYLANWYKVVE